ncbi:MAG: MBL fold metallo-hydrolase [Pseudomonadota bacterium]
MKGVDELILLGTKGGPAVRPGGALPSASLLRLGGETLLIDCGLGATRSLVDAGVNLLDLDAIFVTHLHSDHVLELGPLLYTTWTTGLNRPLKVFGPDGIRDYWAGFLQAMAYDHAIRVEDEGRRPISELIEVVIFGGGTLPASGSVSVKALRVEHPPVTECYALRFETDERAVVFSADTRYFPPLSEFAKDADVIIHEAMLAEGAERIIAKMPEATRLRAHLFASHTLAADVDRIAADAGVAHLVLNHLVPANDPTVTDAHWRQELRQTWGGLLTVGRDGLRVLL